MLLIVIGLKDDIEDMSQKRNYNFNNVHAGQIAGLLTLGQAARTCGISVQSLQYYIMCGLVEPATLTTTNRRLFDQNSLERIKLVKKLNTSGYPLREIREIFLKGK